MIGIPIVKPVTSPCMQRYFDQKLRSVRKFVGYRSAVCYQTSRFRSHEYLRKFSPLKEYFDVWAVPRNYFVSKCADSFTTITIIIDPGKSIMIDTTGRGFIPQIGLIAFITSDTCHSTTNVKYLDQRVGTNGASPVLFDHLAIVIKVTEIEFG